MKLLLLAALLIAALRLLTAGILGSRSQDRDNGFWGAVRRGGRDEPDWARREQRTEEVYRELQGNPEKIRDYLHRYVFHFEEIDDRSSEDHRAVFSRLGEAVHSPLLEILKEPHHYPNLKTRNENLHPLYENSPIERICLILGESSPPEEAIALVEPLYEGSHQGIRKDILLLVGSIGSRESMPLIQRALADQTDEEAYVRSSALMGLLRSLGPDRYFSSAANEYQTTETGPPRMPPQLRDEWFDIVSALWPADQAYAVCDDLPKLLIKLNRHRASEFLTNQRLFTVEFEPVWRIAEALTDSELLPPREIVLSLLDSALAKPLEYPIPTIIEKILILLALYRHPEDLARFEFFSRHAEESIADGAITAIKLYRSKNGSPPENLHDLLQERGWDGLTEGQQRQVALAHLITNVYSGGFGGYYFNGYGIRWEEALAGLKEIGAHRHVEILERTLRAFPDGEPAKDEDTLRKQLAKIARKSDAPFDEEIYEWIDASKETNLNQLIFQCYDKPQKED